MNMRSPTQTKTESSFTPIQTGLLQRKCTSCGQHTIAGGECSECKNRRSPLQRRATNQAEPSEVPSIVHEVLRSAGQPLEPATRVFMESRFNQDFSQIPVHTAARKIPQSKLTISQPEDQYEQEANRVADAVMDLPQSKALPLEPQQSFSKPRFRQDFSQIRVHTDTKAAESARAVNALAYTVGHNIVFGAGQYTPHSNQGKELLAHELAHTLQQEGTSSTKIQRRAVPFEPASIAKQLKEAMEGWGTDEEAIYAALSGRTRSQLDEIATAYLRLTGRNLQADLEDELTSGELLALAAFSPAEADNPEHRAAMVAEQLRAAMYRLGTDETAIYSALNGRTPDELTAIKAAYLRLTGHQLLDDLRDELSGDELQRALGQMDIAPTVYEQNTELGGLSVGNFDFHFKNCAVLVWVWLKFQFTNDINSTEQTDFKRRFINAVHGKWAHSGYSLAGSGSCPCSAVPIEVHVEENSGNFYHKLVDVEKKTDNQRRPMVASDINVNLYTDDTTFAHEFGHVLGLYDEYDGGFFENIMFWHRNQQKDPNALMNMGTELRPRYFEQYRQRVQATAPPGCEYRISTPAPEP